jgi:hypothetical protein
MTPLDYTIFTLLCMIGAYWWGWKKGDWSGSVGMTHKFLKALHEMGISCEVEGKDVYIISAVLDKKVQVEKDDDNGRDF